MKRVELLNYLIGKADWQWDFLMFVKEKNKVMRCWGWLRKESRYMVIWAKDKRRLEICIGLCTFKTSLGSSQGNHRKSSGSLNPDISFSFSFFESFLMAYSLAVAAFLHLTAGSVQPKSVGVLLKFSTEKDSKYTNFTGNLLFVYFAPLPELWAEILFFKSVVQPV